MTFICYYFVYQINHFYCMKCSEFFFLRAGSPPLLVKQNGQSQKAGGVLEQILQKCPHPSGGGPYPVPS